MCPGHLFFPDSSVLLLPREYQLTVSWHPPASYPNRGRKAWDVSIISWSRTRKLGPPGREMIPGSVCFLISCLFLRVFLLVIPSPCCPLKRLCLSPAYRAVTLLCWVPCSNHSMTKALYSRIICFYNMGSFLNSFWAISLRTAGDGSQSEL